jgi:hypothetical protein
VDRVPGDTLLITEAGDVLKRTAGRGEFIESFRPPNVYSNPFATFSDGAFVAIARVTSGPRYMPIATSGKSSGDSVRVRLVEFHLADAGGRTIASLGSMPHAIWTPVRNQLFGPARFHAARERYYTVFSSEYSVHVFGRQGQLELIVRRPATAAQVTAQHIESRKADEVSGIMRSAATHGTYFIEEDVMENQFRGVLPAAQHPVVSGLLVDADEHLWVRDYRIREDGILRSIPAEGGAPQLWRIFNRAGLWVAQIEIPDRLQVTEVGHDYVAGIWRDSLLVQTARIYPLNRQQ